MRSGLFLVKPTKLILHRLCMARGFERHKEHGRLSVLTPFNQTGRNPTNEASLSKMTGE